MSISAELGDKLTSRKAAPGLTALPASAGAVADPVYDVLSPCDRKGITRAELRYWTVEPDRGAATVWPELAIGRGVTSRWTTLLPARFIGPAGDARRPSLGSGQNAALLVGRACGQSGRMVWARLFWPF